MVASVSSAISDTGDLLAVVVVGSVPLSTIDTGDDILADACLALLVLLDLVVSSLIDTDAILAVMVGSVSTLIDAVPVAPSSLPAAALGLVHMLVSGTAVMAMAGCAVICHPPLRV